MIGTDQEPNREALAALNAALGEGNYQIQYEQGPHGVKAIVSTHEKPSRSWNTRFGSGLERVQVDAVWQEFTSRIGKSAGTVEPEQGTTHAEPNAVAASENELGRDNAHVEGGTGTAENPAPGGGGTFESSTADEGGVAPAPSEGDEGEGSRTDPTRR